MTLAPNAVMPEDVEGIPTLAPSTAAQLGAALAIASGGGCDSGSSATLLATDLGHVACTCRELSANPPTRSTVSLSGERSTETAAAALRFFDVATQPRFAGVSVLRVQFCDGLLDTHMQSLPPRLVELSLHCCHKLTDTGVRAAAERCGPTLEVLSLYWNNNVTNASAIAVGRRCARLRSACFSGCKRVGSAGVRALAARGGTLEVLDLTRLPLLADDALAALLERCTHGLRELRLYADGQLGDAPLLALAPRAAHLHTLDCTGVSGIGDAALAAVVRASGGALRQLWLSWATGVGDEGVLAVAQACPRLELLSLHGLLGVSDAALDALVHAPCAATLRALDVRGCKHLSRREPEAIREVLPRVTTFVLAK